MFALSSLQQQRLLVILVAFHILVIAASNYLVQLPFTLFGFHTTWGAFSFPLVFLATDLTVRLFGKEPARAIIFRVMFPALLITYVVSVIFPRGHYAGLEALGEWNLFVFRIAVASFMAYLLGQLMDVQVFDRLRHLRAWWVAPVISTTLGTLIDTAAFFSIAFYNSPDPFMAANWVEIATVDYVFKLGISMLLFVPLYGVLLGWLSRRLVTLTGQGELSPQRS